MIDWRDRGCSCGKERWEYDSCTRADCLKKERPSANSIQIGGTHYKVANVIEHWDMMELYGVGYLESAATKYISRWRKKNGREDLLKSKHYTQKLLELHTAGKRVARGIVPSEVVSQFCVGNGLGTHESRAILLLCRWDKAQDLHDALSAIDRCLVLAEINRSPSAEPNYPGTPEDGGHHARQQQEDDGA